MKNCFGKLLQLVLTLATMSILLTTAFAAETDTMTLSTYPEGGSVAVSATESTPFYVLPSLTAADGTDVTGEYYCSFLWQLDDTVVSTTNYYEFPANMFADAYTLTCSVYARHYEDGTVKTAQVTWYPTVKYTANIELTINENLGEFYFTSTETQNGSSVYKELLSALDLYSGADLSSYTVSFVSAFSQVAALTGNPLCPLTELDELYLSISDSGTWTAHYSVTLDNVEIVSGKLTIVIEPHISMDITYIAAPGENVVIPASAFTNFWSYAAPRITLDSVNITSCTGVNGVLCYGHSAAEKRHTNASGLFMYTESKNTAQKLLADLTFVPNKVSNKYPTGTVTIGFSARGTDRNNKPVTVSGSIVIFYTTKQADTISYSCTATHVMFSASDFIDVYRAVTGSKEKNPSFSIRFLDIPTYGTLYRNYSGDFYGTVNSTALTEKNYSNMSFSSQSTGINAIDKLAYVPSIRSSADETVRYVAYSGTKLLYTGTVSFSSKQFVITYSTTSPLDFSSTDFYTQDSPLLCAQYIIFGTPSAGTLYKDYSDGTGTPIRSGEYFSYQAAYGVSLLDTVTYVPKDGFTGVVEIPFSAFSLTNASISGKIRIYVVAKNFDDVDPNGPYGWAAPYINRLYASGIISGTSATAHTFSPEANMTYGAALKMILTAAGYPKQNETSGNHWASNYLNLAYKKGIVSSTNIDLDAAVTRTTIAELAAKALGLSKASSVNPGIVGPVDSSNGYVYALYNAGIINGSFVGAKNYFYGDKLITRAEVAKIICMINDYIN